MKERSLPKVILLLILMCIILLLLFGCPTSHYISDRGMMSSVEAFMPESDILVDDISCQTIDKKDGACSLVREKGDSIKLSINVITESEISWKSNCYFDVEDPNGGSQRQREGGFVTDKKVNHLYLKNMPESGTVCTVGILILDVEREEGEKVPESQGQISLIHIIVSDPNYIAVPATQIRFKKKSVEIKASKFSKHILLSDGKKHHHLKKLNEFSFDKPKRGTTLFVKVLTDIGRVDKVNVIVP